MRILLDTSANVNSPNLLLLGEGESVETNWNYLFHSNSDSQPSGISVTFIYAFGLAAKIMIDVLAEGQMREI